MNIKRPALLVYAAAACLLSACATDIKIDKYSPDANNIRLLQSKDIEADVGDFTYCEYCSREALEKEIKIRLVTLYSPYSGGFPEYLKESIKLEFMLSDKYKAGSLNRISAVITENRLSSHGSGSLAALVTVNRNGQTAYEKEISYEHSFPFKFMGIQAIHLTRQQYPIMVKALLSKLYSDPDFIKAISTTNEE
ncbi:MAG TPA: hypothetical protein DCR21_03820 [Succinivibrionaceae bacterium]|nr:hypothetical protein [Succinivibrionaceae bacterium]